MIHPWRRSDETKPAPSASYYEVIAWGDKLPAFDPVRMVKTVILSPSSVKRFNRVVLKFNSPLEQSIVAAFILRFATFIVSAPIGRILAPFAALLHILPIVVFVAGMRVEYIKIVVCTFDFGSLFAANTLWAVVFSAVLRDTRAVLVVVCWINFTNALLQETHLRNTNFMISVNVGECLFLMMLMVWLWLELVDGVHHDTVIATRRRTLSTKDVLVNVIGTMSMLLMRNIYCRYQLLQQHKRKFQTATQALGYKCQISLRERSPVMVPPCINVMPITNKPQQSTLLQMSLATEPYRYDPRDTMWPRIGALTPLSSWKTVVIYACGVTDGLCGVLSLFLPRNAYGNGTIAVTGMVMGACFSGIYACCCQRQLLKRVMTSFHFLFLELQIVVAGVCSMDLFNWRWIPVCGITSVILLVHSILTIDALTPVMKRRLHLKYCLFVGGIALFPTVLIVILLDVFILGNWDLRDRVFLDFSILGRRAQLHVAPFLLGRAVTIFVWSSRYIYIVLARHDDNALILLRGNVEFDYESWKKQANFNSRTK